VGETPAWLGAPTPSAYVSAVLSESTGAGVRSWGGKWPTFAGGMDDMDARWRHADLTALLLTLTRPTDRQLREVVIMIDEDR